MYMNYSVVVKTTAGKLEGCEFKPWETFDVGIDQRLLKGWWFDPWQKNFKYFLNSMYK
jgi:hypothetical protein